MFLSTLAEACGKTEWQIHAYCLKGNNHELEMDSKGVSPA